MKIPIKYRLYNNKIWVRSGVEDKWAVARVTKAKRVTPITQYFGNNFVVTKYPPGRSDWRGKLFYGEIIKGIIGHSGIDFTAPNGTRLYAPEDMEITKLTTYDGYGVKAKSKTGQHTFWHLKEFHCSVGQKLKQGDFFALSDNTGKYSTAPHLHWGFKPLNPDKDNGYKGSIDFFKSLENVDVFKLPYKDGQCLIRTGAKGEFYVVENGDLVYYSSDKNPITREVDIVSYFLKQKNKGLPAGFIKVITEEEFDIFRNLIK